MFCWGDQKASCMASLNHGMANPSAITPAGQKLSDPSSGCMFFNVGITQTPNMGNTRFTFSAAPLPSPPPPPAPRCLKLSGATCPDHTGDSGYDGVFKRTGFFADGTPYYRRISAENIYLFWQVG